MTRQEIETRLDELEAQCEDAAALEQWAAENGAEIDMSEYDGEEGVNVDKVSREGDDDLPVSLTEGDAYNGRQDDGRDVTAYIVSDTSVRITAVNCGACGRNYQSRAWDIDVDSLPEAQQ